MAIAKQDQIPLTPLRERFAYLEERYGITAADIARELGWTRKKRARDGALDVTRVKRALGLVENHDRGGCTYVQQYTSYEQAVRLCRALDMDPFEAGV